MKSVKFLIVGGGPSGLGFADGLSSKNESDFLLVEGRDQVLYTLNWMPFVKNGSSMFETEMTGVEFKQYLSTKDRDNSKILFATRLFNLDRENNIAYINRNGESNEKIKYEKLVIAVGGIQILYGSYLLPGFRGAGIFTTYQVGEMLSSYDFIPGKSLFIIARSQYSIDVAKLAKNCGIEVTMACTGNFDFKDSSIRLYENIEILEIMGEKDKRITGIKFLFDGKEISIPTESLAVDGKFTVEHKMKDLLGLKWDIKEWKAELNNEYYLSDNIIVIGDANKPDENYMKQYEKAFTFGKEQ